MFAFMTTREIYREYLQQLQQIYNKYEAAIITDWVFEKLAALQRADIVKQPGQIMDPLLLDQLNNCLVTLLRHKPVQYVLNEAWFFKMKLFVNEQVLIPRPETEELVQLVIDNWRSVGNSGQSAPGKRSVSIGLQATAGPICILDIGTGSGCIAIALKKNLPGTRILAVDISSGALSVALENAGIQEVEIEFLQVDFLEESQREALPVFDVIISNPPYIPLKEKGKLDKNVSDFEPGTALFVPDNNPLLFYEKIADFGVRHLRSDGKIYVEIHEDYAEKAMEVFEQCYLVEIKKDMFGKDRMLIAGKARQKI